MVYLYILRRLKDKGFYIGITKSPEERVSYHNKGKVKSTKNRRPFVLIYTEVFSSYQEARLREKEIKGYKSGNKFKELIKNCRIV